MPDAFQSFHDSIRLAEIFISRGQLSLAKEQYSQLLFTYNQLMSMPGDSGQKASAHLALTRLYNALSSPDPTSALQQLNPSPANRFQTNKGIGITTLTQEQSQRPSMPVYAAIFLLLVFSVAVFIKPEFLGMATFEGTPRITEYLAFHLVESSTQPITLKHIPSGLGISGKVTKINDKGSAKVFIKHNGNQLLFDSTQESLVNGVFQNQCVACALPGYDSRNIQLVVELQNATLDLDSITYTVEEKHNSPPAWIGGEKTLGIHGKTVIDLNKNFKDPDGDELVFLIAGNDLDTTLDVSKLTLTPKTTGKYQLTIIASDLLKVTKVPVIVDAT